MSTTILTVPGLQIGHIIHDHGARFEVIDRREYEDTDRVAVTIEA